MIKLEPFESCKWSDRDSCFNPKNDSGLCWEPDPTKCKHLQSSEGKANG